VTLWEDQLRSWNHVMRDDFFDRQQLTGQSFSARCILYQPTRLLSSNISLDGLDAS
jgi:hypothetical protein